MNARAPWTPSLADGETLISYSQNAEDIRLWRVFQDVANGFYVDVGAADPVDGSVTKLFYDRGWSGINVEPSPTFEALDRERPRDVNVRAAVGETEEPVTFYVMHPDLGMSTTDPAAHAHVPQTIERTEEIEIPQRRLDALLEEHARARELHFLKVDVEGAERQVLASSDWERFRPRVVVVEAVESWSTEPTHRAWEDILLDAAYEFAVFDGINRFYVDAAHRDLIPTLAYPISALDRFVPAQLANAESEVGRLGRLLERERTSLRTSLEHARLALESARAEDEALRRSLERTGEELTAVTREKDALAAQVGRLSSYAEHIDAIYQSRTWRTGRAVAKVAGPSLVAAQAVRRRVPKRGRRAASPARAFVEAVGRGQAWHFSRARQGRRARTGLDGVVEAFGRSSGPLTPERAQAVIAAAAASGWTDEDSLLTKRLPWVERHAVLEADAVARLAAGLPSSPPPEDGTARGPVVVVDVRNLQDPGLGHRGVGLHSRTVLRAVRQVAGSRPVVLLAAAELPPLEPEVAAAGASVVYTPYALRGDEIDLYVELSPMTASAAPSVPFLALDSCRTAAIVYDFIPTEFPEAYLRSSYASLANRARLEALRRYDLLLPISRATEAAGRRVLGDGVRTAVTGVGDPLWHVDAAPASVRRPFMLVPIGGDPRKNGAAALAALAHYRRNAGSDLNAVVTGVLSDPQARALQRLAERLGLDGSAVELRGRVSEGELATLYGEAELTFVGSYAEGFSIPVAESVARRTPVVVSNIDAHRELVGDGPWLAPPDSIGKLSAAIEHVSRNAPAVLEAQRRALGDTADPNAVFARIVRALATLSSEMRPQRRRRTTAARPRIAVASPFPPQRSGIADYTAFTFAEVAKHADVEVFASVPAPDAGLPVRPLSAAPYLDGKYDAIVGVAGNSHFHFVIQDFLDAYGGACIAHDNRMVESYRWDRGDGWTASLLSDSGRVVRGDEISALLLDLDELPALGYRVLARQASPLIVHGRALAERIDAETGVAPAVVPFVPYNVPRVPRIDGDARAAARDALGIATDEPQVATFGIVDRRTKGVDLIVGAAAWLRTWKVAAHLHVVGDAPAEEHTALAALCDEYGISDAVTFHGRVDRATLEQYLLAVDVAIQLRRSGVLSLSGAFADCIAFGVPTIATADLAEELDAPSYVTRCGVATSSLLLAEAIEASLARRRTEENAIDEERRDYLDARSVAAYARHLLTVLGLDPQ